jgi:hypothetical protein
MLIRNFQLQLPFPRISVRFILDKEVMFGYYPPVITTPIQFESFSFDRLGNLLEGPRPSDLRK